MGKIVLILWIAAIAFGGFWLGYYQEGANQDLTLEFTSKGSMPGWQGWQPGSGKLYLTKDGLALSFDQTGRQQAGLSSFVINMDENKIYVVTDAPRKVQTIQLTLVEKTECEPGTAGMPPGSEDVERTASSKTIAGYRCHGFQMKDLGGFGVQGTAWFTYELPLGRNKLGLINKMLRIKKEGDAAKFSVTGGSAGAKTKYRQYSSPEYFPVPLAVEIRSTNRSFEWTVTSVKRGKVDKAKLTAPKN